MIDFIKNRLVNANEYGLILFKPDGIENNLTDEILSVFSRYGLEPIKIRIFQLTPRDVLETFANVHQEYIDYMCRRSVMAVLLWGENAFYKIRLLKPQIRQYYGGGEIENFIHSPESGNEYDIQVRVFFPEINIEEVPMYADMYSKINFPVKKSDFFEKMNAVQSSSKTRASAFIFQNSVYQRLQDNLLEYIDKNNTSHITLGMEYCSRMDSYPMKILAYYKVDNSIPNIENHIKLNYSNLEDLIGMIRESKGIPFLAPTFHLFNKNCDYYIKLKELGIVGGVVYHPRYTVEETDFLTNQTIGRGITMSGGSAGIANYGRFGISYELFHSIYKMLYLEDPLDTAWLKNKEIARLLYRR